MGTNYYHRTNICDGCNRFNELHIGKSSAGWQFSFQGCYNFGDEEKPDIRSFEDWKKRLQAGGKIFSEYKEEISFEDFVALVEGKQTGTYNNRPNMNHYDHCKEEGYDMKHDWKDNEGYSFTVSEFS